MSKAANAIRQPSRARHKLAPNPGGQPKLLPLPDELIALKSKPREKKGEYLLDQSFQIAYMAGEDILKRLQRAGKKDWNGLHNAFWCWGVAADKLLKTMDNAEEIRIKLPSQLQDGVKVMMRLEIERKAAPTPQPVVVDAVPDSECPVSTQEIT